MYTKSCHSQDHPKTTPRSSPTPRRQDEDVLAPVNFKNLVSKMNFQFNISDDLIFPIVL